MARDKIGVSLTYKNLWWQVDARARARLSLPRVVDIFSGVGDGYYMPSISTSYTRIMDRCNVAPGRGRFGHDPRLWMTSSQPNGVWG